MAAAMVTLPGKDTFAAPGGYVPETAFGVWFQRSGTWSRYVVSDAVDELASLLPAGRDAPARVLDIGCGEGVAFDMLQRTFGAQSIVGIDIDPESVRRAGEAATRVGGNIEVRLADGARLPVADSAFDLVFCHQVLHHANDPSAVLRECRRVLAPGGRLLVAESCRTFLSWWPVRLLFRHPPRRQQTASEYRALVQEAGFSVADAGYLTPAPWWSLRDLGLRRRYTGVAPRGEPTQVRIAASDA
jgi:SAM-dependent methyltransferase